eukprot:TRINITY_DN4878_c0_g1_i6.p1 TRINITY_DN4878_c0_g1~~TRINITY_DN4878_c0_g1_i6.p1  ORF type:complete len:390 (+),score=90.35 TRINITY_DN4878_c0_g1_i6:585-1754(+)
MQAVASSLLHIADMELRATAFQSFVADWAHGNTFWKRIAFLEAAEAAAASYSRILFRDLFAALALRMAWDSVPNVRLHLARTLPAIAPACHQMEEFANALGTLRVDEDEDVVAQLAVSEGAIAVRSNDAAMVAAADKDDAQREDAERLRYECSLASRPDSVKRRVFRRATKRIGRAASQSPAPRPLPSPAASGGAGASAVDEAPFLAPTLEEVGKSATSRVIGAGELPVVRNAGSGAGASADDVFGGGGAVGTVPNMVALPSPTLRRRTSSRAERVGGGAGALPKTLTASVLSSGGGATDGTGGGALAAPAVSFTGNGAGADSPGAPGGAVAGKAAATAGGGALASTSPVAGDVSTNATAKRGRTPRGGSFLTMLKTVPRRKLKDTEAT